MFCQSGTTGSYFINYVAVAGRCRVNDRVSATGTHVNENSLDDTIVLVTCILYNIKKNIQLFLPLSAAFMLFEVDVMGLANNQPGL